MNNILKANKTWNPPDRDMAWYADIAGHVVDWR